MVTAGVDRLFVDTNILLFASSKDSPFQTAAELSLGQWRSQSTGLFVSTQILREYLAVTTRPAPGRPTEPDYEAITKNLLEFRKSFRLLEETCSISEKLESLVSEFSVKGKQVHDANIVASMLVHGVFDLFTHNTGDFERFSALITIHPLL
jgi:predicted nucleic acid-binding protein